MKVKTSTYDFFHLTINSKDDLEYLNQVKDTITWLEIHTKKEIVDLSVLKKLPRLNRAVLKGNFVGIEQFLIREDTIDYLIISSENEPFDLNLLAYIPKLKVLNINGSVKGFDYLSKNRDLAVCIQYPSKVFMDCIKDVETIMNSKLTIVSDKKTINLDLLNKFPELKSLGLTGKFENYEEVSKLEKLKSLDLSISENDINVLESLMTDKLERLGIEGEDGMTRYNISTIANLSFLSKAPNLQVLYLRGLSKIEELPELGNISELKIYGLHKLNNLEALKESKIESLSLMLCADKLTGTAIAKIVSEMKHLEKFDFGLDRGPARDTVLKNQLIKMNLDYLLN